MTDQPLEIEYRKLDPTIDPLSELALRRWIADGLPPEAVRPDRTLDPDVLARHGWKVSRGWVYGPAEP